MANIKITLQDYTANVRLNSNRIQLRSGVTCGLSRASCTDIEGGHTFWDPVPTDSYKFYEYSALYQEYADKIIDSTSESTQIVYSLTKHSFALTKFTRCGYTLIRTEHSKLMIFETTPGDLSTYRSNKQPRHFYLHEFKICLCRKAYSHANQSII